MLSEEQANRFKEQIIQQIDSWKASDEQKQQAKKQILSMTKEELEKFLIKNNLIKSEEKEKITEASPEQCPFCLIAENKTPSFKIDENKASIAVLEINPLSRGHSIIIPKKHQTIEKSSSQSFTLAKKVAKKLKSKFKPLEINIQSANAFGHGIINVIPLYENEKLERKKIEEEKLKEMQEKLINKPKIKKEKTKPSQKQKQLEKAPRRIP